MASENVITTNKLTKRYGPAITAVDTLDLAVRRGEVFGFLGPNGAGKTTTLRMLLGLIRPTSGSAIVAEHRPGDPQGVVEMRSLLRRLGTGKRTVLLSSHLLNEVQQISDRVAIIRKGKLVAQGTVHELRGESAIVVRVTPVDAARRQLDRMLGAAAVTAVDGTLRLSVDPDKSADINAALVGAGIKVSELRAVERTLEEVFLTLTGEAA